MESILNAGEIEKIKEIGEVARLFLKKIKRVLKAGQTTADIESFFNQYLKDFPGMRPAFRGYRGYPASLCISVNEEVIHGIPSRHKVINNGDIVSIDLGIEKDGLFVDCAYTYLVGSPLSSVARKLVKVGLSALRRGIKAARVGATTGDIGFAIESFVKRYGFSVIRSFVGHGVGKALHCSPEVPNFGNPGEGDILKEGMTIAIEPMITNGTYEVEVLPDGWTVRTRDNSLSSHFEHTVVVTRRGPLIVT